MPNAPVTIYNRDRERVAYCEQAFDIGYRLQKDALWRAWFSLPLDDPKNDEISDLYYAEIYDGDTRIELFRIISIRKRRSNGIPVLTYTCEHVLGTLIDKTLVGVFNAGPGTTQAITDVLAEQPVANWVLDTCDFSRNFYHDWEDVTLLKALFSIPTRFTNDHVWTWDTTTYPWRLSLETAPATVSAKIRYQRELKDIQKDSDARYLYTRLYPWGFGAGADQLDILTVDQMAEGRPEFISGSTKFTVGETLTGATSGETCVVASSLLESGVWGGGDAQGPLFVTGMSGAFTDGEDLNGSASGANCATLDSSLDHVNAETIVTYGIISRSWHDQRYTIAANLHEQAQARVDENSVPRATYRLSAMDFNRLAGTNRYVLGDLVRVYDSELGIDVNVRVTLVSKGDVEGRPGDITLQLATEEEKFVNFGGIVYADDLDGVQDGTFGKVLSTSIQKGKILLSQIAGGQLGAIPSPPTIGGLYLGSDHMGYHDGSDWISYFDNAGVMQLNGIGADNAHIQWDPSGGGTLDIKSANVDISGTMTITAGVVGGFNVDPTEGLYIGTGATRVQMKPGAGIWCGATAIGDAPFSATDAGVVKAVSGTIGGWTLGASTLANGTDIILDASNKKISIKSATFENAGIQLDYNGGTPQFYVGDGSNEFIMLKASKLQWKAANSELDASGNLSCSNLTLTGGSININGGVFTVSAAGALVATSATITGALTAGGGSNIPWSYISSVSIDNADITDLAFSKITAATSTASLVIGGAGYLKSSNYSAGSAGFQITGAGNAEFNDVTVRGKIIANVAGSNVPWGYISSVNVVYGQIAANAVRTNELYVDGDINFGVTGTPKGIFGGDFMGRGTSKADKTKPHIQFDLTKLWLASGTASGNDIELTSTDDIIIGADNAISLAAGAGYNIALQPGANNNDAVTGVLKYINYRIHNGNAPVGWTEVNASGEIGSRRCMLLMRIENNGVGSVNVRFRPSDEAGEQDPDCQNWPGAFGTRVDDGQEVQWLWILTGSTGRYDWDADAARSVYVNILAYIACA